MSKITREELSESLLNDIQQHKLVNDEGYTHYINSGSCNDLITSGFYTITGDVTDGPSFGEYIGYFYLEVIANGVNWVTQRATIFEATGYGARIWIRGMQNKSWSDWKELSDTEQINELMSTHSVSTSYQSIPENFHVSANGVYFNEHPEEKNLDNIRFNLFTLTTEANALENLPFKEAGGGGILLVHAFFSNNSTTAKRIKQTYINSVSGKEYIRCYNGDSTNEYKWTPWVSINNEGTYITQLSNETDIDTIYSGEYDILNATGTLPGSLVSGSNNVFIKCMRRTDNYLRQFCYDVRSINSWERVRVNGTWSAWRSL